MAGRFYISTLQQDSTWGKAKNVGAPVNTALNEGAPSYSADGQLIFLLHVTDLKVKGSCDIYYSRKFGDAWENQSI